MKRLLACVLLFSAPLVACGGEELPLAETEEVQQEQVTPAPEAAVAEEGEVEAAAGCWVTLRTCRLIPIAGGSIPDCSATNCTVSQRLSHCWGLWNDICS
ncbi:hypothetical protein [Pyxidicoccus xibeiensis]|uniref:hypothetical protein n=1 Tax=Pyxidicoccus xibeiensis TaxID=2906759 RepID=UPI0020A8233D|nr:hypothetical protein [Pyxidicoccus xibeiensis]MCP3139233.1 hypothetical protein [Pyxidicoccus xibeiensis]